MIKELREKSSMSQVAFASYLNIPVKTIQNWEQGTRKCPEYVVQLIEYKLKKESLI